MAVITSTTTGNFSAGATWVGGVVPGPADDAVAATGTVVTIDTNVTVLSFQQAGTGKFVLGGGRTVTGNVIANAGTFTSGGTVEVTAGVGTTATINGNVTGVSTTANNTAGIVVTGVGTLVLNGNVTGSPGNNSSEANGSAGVYTNVTCTVTINGAVTGGTGQYKNGFRGGASSNAVITVIGNASSGSSTFSHGVNVAGATTTVNVTGNVKSNAQAAHGISPTGASQVINITGNVDGGGGTGAYGINATGSLTITVVGNVSGSTGINSTGINATGTSAVINVTGSCIGNQGSAYGVEASGTSSVVTLIGSAVGGITTASGLVSAANATNTGVIFQGNQIDGSGGARAIYTRLMRITGTNSGYDQHQNTVGFPNGTPVFRVSPDQVTGMPSAANVRSGTIYGYSNQLTGTAIIPPASSVAAGVEVDNTTGTAALDVGTIIAVTGAQVAAASSNPSVV